ncbi:hypothetical protein Ancab_012601 [Ancistrocladus abbreviatus]
MAKTTRTERMKEEGVRATEAGMLKITTSSKKKGLNRGVWTAEEDKKLAQVIEICGPKRWKTIAAKAGLKRCGKSCRLRWMNYLRPNIKRGNISDQEEDLILRLHKLLGNRWSLIAGRLPGRTDNEIKNYWNSHLSKKLKQERKQTAGSTRQLLQSSGIRVGCKTIAGSEVKEGDSTIKGSDEEMKHMNFDIDDFFDFSNENPSNLEWVSRFVDADESLY